VRSSATLVPAVIENTSRDGLLALVAKRYGPFLKTFHEGIRRRRGTGKAIVATARKLLTIVYYALKNDWVFDDFGHFVLAG